MRKNNNNRNKCRTCTRLSKLETKNVENEKFRQENQINLVAHGHEEDNENKVWAVIDVPSV